MVFPHFSQHGNIRRKVILEILKKAPLILALRISSDNDQLLTGKLPERLDLELDPFLRVYTIYREPEIPVPGTVIMRYIDRRIENCCIPVVIHANTVPDNPAVGNDSVEMPDGHSLKKRVQFYPDKR
jgi:hypothetical protein